MTPDHDDAALLADRIDGIAAWMGHRFGRKEPEFAHTMLLWEIGKTLRALATRPAQVGAGGEWLRVARELYDRCCVWPEKSGDGFMALIELRNHVQKLLTTPQPPPEAVESPAYDRELIADMLAAGGDALGHYASESVAEQIALLRDAENACAEDVHTRHADVPGSPPSGQGVGEVVAWRLWRVHSVSREWVPASEWIDGAPDADAIAEADGVYRIERAYSPRPASAVSEVAVERLVSKWAADALALEDNASDATDRWKRFGIEQCMRELRAALSAAGVPAPPPVQQPSTARRPEGDAFDALYDAAPEGKQAMKGVCRYWYEQGAALSTPPSAEPQAGVVDDAMIERAMNAFCKAPANPNSDTLDTDLMRAALLAAMRAVLAPCETDAAIAAHGRVDVEAMLTDCVPGGSICDPQQVADNIRRYLSAATPPSHGGGARDGAE